MGSETAGAVALAAGAGVATFFSACAYALLPGYVGYYVSAAGDEDDVPIGGTLLRGLAACLGVVLVFAVLSVGIVLVGRSIEPVLDILEPAVGVALLTLGVAVLAGYDASVHMTLPERRTSLLGFVLFGGGYAVAGAGCVAPLFLAIVLRAVTFPPGQAVLVLGGYAVGFGALLRGATVAIGAGRRGLLDLLGQRRRLLDGAAGAALVVAGAWQLFVVV